MQCHGVCSIYKVNKDGLSRVLCDCITALLYFYIYFADRASPYNVLVGGQLDAQFFYIIRLFQSCTCFEQTRAHHQEVNCINKASGIVTLCKWPSGMQVGQLDLHTGQLLIENDYTRCCINTTDLLMMSTCLLETCRRLK